MSRALVLAACLAVALPLAGCAGGDPETQSTSDVNGATSSTSTRAPRAGAGASAGAGSASASASASPGNGTSGNGAGNETGNQTADGDGTGNATGNATWQYDNRTGTVDGTAVPLLGDEFSEEEAFDVANGTLRLIVNLTVDGDDVTLRVAPPGCEQDDCATEVETADGQATFEPEGNVTAGEWLATLTVSGLAGPVGADYELGIATLVVVPGNGTAASSP